MTRVLVLGGTGMLGHKVWQECAGRFEAWATVRGEHAGPAAAAILDPERTIGGVRVDDPTSVAHALEGCEADVAINCIGVVKQARAAGEGATLIRANALFPHELAGVCRERGVRLVQVSTDCVFSGERGHYSEDDVPDARDLYGRSKLLGEVDGDGCLTVRTSIVGRELAGSQGLLEWLIAQRGQAVRGFRRAVFSGLTTQALARELAGVIEDHADLCGVWHVGGDRIDKHELLTLARDALGLDAEIDPDETVVIDRSLDSTRFRQVTGRTPPSWPEMIEELALDATPYPSSEAITAPGSAV